MSDQSSFDDFVGLLDAREDERGGDILESASTRTIVPIAIPANVGELFVAGGTRTIVATIKAKVAEFELDISTELGRKQVASVARRIASSKTLMDDAGKRHVAQIKAQASAIDAERKWMRDELDSLKEQVRKPLTDWEEKQKQRCQEHEDRISEMRSLVPEGITNSTDLQERIDCLHAAYDRDWEEFADRAMKIMAHALGQLQSKLATAIEQEAQRAELAKLRQEAAERAQRDRDERLKKEAAENAARIEREIAARAAAKAEEDAKRDQQAAIEHERARAAAEAKARADEDAKRMADESHRHKIECEIIDALNSFVDKPEARVIWSALKHGDIPHVRIEY